jgi:hypothetical protein
MGEVAFFVGALAVTGLITIGFAKALRLWNADVPGLLVANALSLIAPQSLAGSALLTVVGRCSLTHSRNTSCHG